MPLRTFKPSFMTMKKTEKHTLKINIITFYLREPLHYHYTAYSICLKSGSNKYPKLKLFYFSFSKWSLRQVEQHVSVRASSGHLFLLNTETTQHGMIKVLNFQFCVDSNQIHYLTQSWRKHNKSCSVNVQLTFNLYVNK